MLSNQYDDNVVYLIKAFKNAIDLYSFEDYNLRYIKYQDIFDNSKVIF